MGEAVRMTRGRNKGVDSLGVEIDLGHSGLWWG